MRNFVTKPLAIALGLSISTTALSKDGACHDYADSWPDLEDLLEIRIQSYPAYRSQHIIEVNTTSGSAKIEDDGKCSLYEALLAAQLKKDVDACQGPTMFTPNETILFELKGPVTITPEKPIQIPTPEAAAMREANDELPLYPSIMIDGGGNVTIDGSKIVQDLGTNLPAIGRKVAPSIFMIGSGEGWSSSAPSIHQDCIDAWARYWPQDGKPHIYPDGDGPWIAEYPYAAAYSYSQ